MAGLVPNMALRVATRVFVVVTWSLALSPDLRGDDTLQISGFGALRGTTKADNPLEADSASAQIQAGIDWSPSPMFLVHLHLLARTDDGESLRGHAGTPEAYAEAHLPAGGSRFKLRAGAFFLPTSRENVDALWENAYAISSSALNSWFGEEFRPIGLDVAWFGWGATVGATVFRGNETFGALPLAPGWSLHDRWTVLGQKVHTFDDLDTQEPFYASVSAENDDRLGWSARAGWSSDRLSVLFTHIDNRGTGEAVGDLDNWKTRFEVVGFDYKWGDWTVAGEAGWGPTEVFFPGGSSRSDLRAGYLLVSRRLRRVRATARFEAFSDDAIPRQALTLAALWTPVAKLTVGIELSVGGGEQRGLGDLRYRFSAP
jgi:hypothetical protein